MDELVTKHGFSVKFGPAYSPWSNGINEQNRGISDSIWKKAMMSDLKLTQQQSVDLERWVHNTNVNRLDYPLMHLMIGKVMSLPGFTEETRVTDTNVESKIVERVLRIK